MPIIVGVVSAMAEYCVQSLMLIEQSVLKVYRDEPDISNTWHESYLLLCLGYLSYEVSQKVLNLVNHP